MFALVANGRIRPGARDGSAAIFPLVDHALQQVWTHPDATIVVSRDPSSAGEPRLVECQRTGVVLALWGRIDNREELRAQLGCRAGEYSARLALEAWHAWGRACGSRIEGGFSFVLFDPRDSTVFALRDSLGIKPLYYAACGQGTAVATSIPALCNLTGQRFAPDPDWIARFIAQVSMSCEATPFRGITKVPPGHWLAWSATGVRVARYHRFDERTPLADRRDPAILAAYRSTLEEAVRCRLESPDPAGIETSGGLDSSTVVGLAPQIVECADEQLHGFGFVSAQREPERILAVSRFAGLRNNHLLLRGVVARGGDPFARGVAVLGHPAEHANSTSHLPIYDLARQLGVRTLLSGFGGDEGVTNPALNHRRDLLQTGQYRALWALLRGNVATRAMRFAKARYRHRRYGEFSSEMLPVARMRMAGHILAPAMAEHIGLSDALLEIARRPLAHETLNGSAIAMLEEAFVSTRTESCSLVAATYGIEYAWPLLDRRLIATWLAAPTIEKASRDMGRYLHRRALRGIVPEAIRLQPSKYMGPIIAGTEQPLDDGVDEVVEDMHPALAPIVSPASVKTALATARGGESDKVARRLARRTLHRLSEADRWLRQLDDGAFAPGKVSAR